MREAESKHLDTLFLERWSPRSFLDKTVEDEKLEAIFEAARWAPSCFNEQPWLFMYAKKKDGKNPYLEGLVEGNQKWAQTAPILGFIFASKTFSGNGENNDWAKFDTGSAFMSLNLQAHMLGLSTHAMGGFEADKAYELTNVPKDKYDVICAIAIGYKGSPDQLEGDLKESEKEPTGRKKLETVYYKDTFPQEG